VIHVSGNVDPGADGDHQPGAGAWPTWPRWEKRRERLKRTDAAREGGGLKRKDPLSRHPNRAGAVDGPRSLGLGEEELAVCGPFACFTLKPIIYATKR